MRICLIGCGGMATSMHCPSYLKYKDCNADLQLLACSDINENAARKIQETFGFEKFYKDYKEMLECEKPDGVCLIVPEHLTMQIAIDVMEMGFNIILEKPPGLDSVQTQKMIDVAREKNVINQVAFNRRFSPLVSQLKMLLAGKKIYNIHCDFFRVMRRENHFYTTAIHCIDTVKYLAGEDYKDILFTYQPLIGEGEGVSNTYMSCNFKNNVYATLNICPTVGVNKERITVNCADNTYVLDLPIGDFKGKLTCFLLGEISMEITGDVENYINAGFYNENADFFDNVKKGIKSENDIKSGLQSVECANCIKLRKKEYICS